MAEASQRFSQIYTKGLEDGRDVIHCKLAKRRTSFENPVEGFMNE